MIMMHSSALLLIRTRCLFFAALSLFYVSLATVAQTNEFQVFDSQLSKGLDMGVDSSERRSNWVSKVEGYVKMAYPSGQDWGAVFITVGKPKDPPRPSRDLSAFRVLVVELRGDSGGEQVEIGIKTNKQSDDGSEVKIPVKLTTAWQVFKFPLSKFDVDLRNLYVVTEFVFSGGRPQTVYFRNISYGAKDGGPVSTDDKRDATDNSALKAIENNNSNPTGSTETPVSVPQGAKESLGGAERIVSKIISVFFGAVLLIILLWVLSSDRRFKQHQLDILRFLMASAAAFFATFFVGGVILDGTWSGFALSATGGFVIFILIFFSSRFHVKTSSTRTKYRA